MHALAGVLARRGDGLRGRVLDVSSPWVRIRWDGGGVLEPREVRLCELDERLALDIEVLTVRGWCYFSVAVEQVEQERGVCLGEAAHDPFRYKAKLGPGPYDQRRRRRRQDRFKCQCDNRASAAVCKCKRKHGSVRVEIPYEYKNDYNETYRKWLERKANAKALKKKRAASVRKHVPPKNTSSGDRVS